MSDNRTPSEATVAPILTAIDMAAKRPPRIASASGAGDAAQDAAAGGGQRADEDRGVHQ